MDECECGPESEAEYQRWAEIAFPGKSDRCLEARVYVKGPSLSRYTRLRGFGFVGKPYAGHFRLWVEDWFLHVPSRREVYDRVLITTDSGAYEYRAVFEPPPQPPEPRISVERVQ